MANHEFFRGVTTEVWLVPILFLGISLLASAILKNKFIWHSKIPLAKGLSGKEIAEKMLRKNGTYDLKMTSVGGFQTFITRQIKG